MEKKKELKFEGKDYRYRNSSNVRERGRINMLIKITCPNCSTVNHINPEKHKFRPKYCINCRSPIHNLHPKLRVLSMFQRRKRERKQRTRENYINRIVILLWSQLKRKPTMQEVETIAKKGYCKKFEGEE